MPFELEVVADARLAEVTGYGRIDFDESLAAGDALEAEPTFRPDYAVLVDLRRIEFAPDTPEVEAFARTLPRFKACCRGRIAVVTGNVLHFGLARMVCLIAEAAGFPMRPFSDYAEARSWLLEAEPGPD